MKSLMEKDSNFDLYNLETEYIEIKRGLFKKLIKFLIILFLGLCGIETFRAIVQLKFTSLAHVPILLIFASFAYTLLKKDKGDQDLSGTIFCVAFYLYGVGVNYYGGIGYFETPVDSFYFAYVCAFIERLTTKNIPTPQHKILYYVCVTLIRLLVVTPNQKSTYLRQLFFLGLNIYLDLDKDKRFRNLLFSYFSNKDQLTKFKDLLVHDIPEGIAIVSRNLAESLFTNNSFENLFKGTKSSCLQTQLDQFVVQKSSEKSDVETQSSSSSSSRNLVEPITLLNLLENNNFLDSTGNFIQAEKLSYNVMYSKRSVPSTEKAFSEQEKNQEYFFEAKLFSITWDKVPSVAIILHDITQQRTILSLQIESKHKDTVLATVSHELRTPLNGILGMIQIMQKRINDAELLQYLSICKKSAELLLGLVNSILDLNQIRAKKIRLYPEAFSVHDFLQNIVCLFEFQCKQKGIYLKLRISPRAPRYLFTDKSRLTQVFINLVGNALKFTSEGGITIGLENYTDDSYVQFSVEDTGIGIKDQEKNQLFQMFGRLENANKDINRQGVGLGLTISENLVRVLNGDPEKRGIVINSKYGLGTAFSFLLKKKLGDMTDPEDAEFSKTEFCSEIVNHEKNFISEKLKIYETFAVANSEVFQGFKSNHRSERGGHNTENFQFKNRCSNIGDSVDSEQLSSFDKLSAENVRSTINLDMRSKTQPFNMNCRSTLHGVKPQIILVDDNPFNLFVAEHLIACYGYGTKTALDGRTAINLVINNSNTAEPIKLILMDCEMPLMSGYETCKCLRELMQKKVIPSIPIVALTADNSESNKKKCIQAGMCDHLMKPLQEIEFKKILLKYDRIKQE